MAYTPYNPGYQFPLQYAQPAAYQARQDIGGQGYPGTQLPSPAPAQTPQQGFGCRPVTSREEALAMAPEYFGPGTIMPDLAHGVIYLKRFNQNTGASDFFEFVARAPETEKPIQYVTIDDLNALRDEIMKKQGKAAKKNDPDE